MRTRLGVLCLVVGLAAALSKASLVEVQPATCGVEVDSGAAVQDLYEPPMNGHPTISLSTSAGSVEAPGTASHWSLYGQVHLRHGPKQMHLIMRV